MEGTSTKHSKVQLWAAIVMVLFLLSCFTSVTISDHSAVHIKNHPQPGIWDYDNLKINPKEPLVVSLDQVPWQAQASACMAPVFYDRFNSTPLMFDDGSEDREISIPHVTQGISSYGTDAQSASAGIATTYWSQAEIVVVANSYEQVLQGIPIASFLLAPILVNPTQQTLNSLKTKCAIIIGEGSIEIEEMIFLETKEEVWTFQLELFDMKGQICDYIVLTNPYDTERDDNIKWKFHSLASACLAAKRLALVQTGNYTGDRANIGKIAKATKTRADTYEDIRPLFEKVKIETYNASLFLMDNGHDPEFLALVGGSYAIPDYYFDYHISYFYWGTGVDYVASSAPYGNLSDELVYTDYPYEDLGVGRILGHSILDSTIQLTRTFFYREFLQGGAYSNLVPDSWEQRSAVVEGHRLNQPQPDGPPAVCDEPYFPSGEVDTLFSDTGFNETYHLPRNFTESEDLNSPIGEILDNALNSSMVLINAHGGLPGEQALIEVGLDTLIGKEYLFTLDAEEAKKRNLPPSIVYVIGCETGTTAVDIPMDKYVALGFVHSGAVAYLAPDTYQTICFWDKAPYGPEADQTILFFQSLLNENIPIGRALSEAKWVAAQNWLNTSSSEDDVGGTTLHLYGDPAFEPFKPEVPFDDRKKMDIHATYDGLLDAGSSFSINIATSDLESGQEMDDVKITLRFQGKKIERTKANFEAPSRSGFYKVEVTAEKGGYQEVQARYVVHVHNDDEGMSPYLLLSVVVLVTLVIVVTYRRKKR
jgi:hypothetical protein